MGVRAEPRAGREPVASRHTTVDTDGYDISEVRGHLRFLLSFVLSDRERKREREISRLPVRACILVRSTSSFYFDSIFLPVLFPYYLVLLVSGPRQFVSLSPASSCPLHFIFPLPSARPRSPEGGSSFHPAVPIVLLFPVGLLAAPFSFGLRAAPLSRPPSFSRHSPN